MVIVGAVPVKVAVSSLSVVGGGIWNSGFISGDSGDSGHEEFGDVAGAGEYRNSGDRQFVGAPSSGDSGDWADEMSLEAAGWDENGNSGNRAFVDDASSGGSGDMDDMDDMEFVGNTRSGAPVTSK